MAVSAAPIPLPSRPNAPTMRKMLSAEHFEALSALYPKALAAIAERLDVANDMTAARVVIEAVASKGRLIAFGDVSPAGITRLMAAGIISPAEASAALAVVRDARAIEEMDALAARIERLENAISLVDR